MLHELRFAVKMAARRPGFTAMVVATLALSVGATTSLAAIIRSVLLEPFPFRAQSRLMTIWLRDTARDQPFLEVSYPDYLDWRTGDTGFQSLAAMPSVNLGTTLTGRGEPRHLQVRPVSANFFEVLGSVPALGGTFDARDDRPGAAKVAVISHRLWTSLFAEDPRAIGQLLILDGHPHTIAGVMPPEFQYPAEAALWTPIETAVPTEALENLGVHWLILVGRLRDGVSAEQARAALDTVVRRLDRRHWGKDTDRAVVKPLVDQIVGHVRRPLLALGGAVVLVLLIGCANVAGLLLSRAVDRRREMAIRVALGAPVRRLARQTVIEVLPLALVAGAAGLLLSYWILRAVASAPGVSVPRAETTGVDPFVAGFALAASLLTAGLCALAPALDARSIVRTSLADRLKHASGGGESPRPHRLRDLLVIAEMALAVIVTAGALLLVRSFAVLMRSDFGFEPRRVLALEIPLSGSKYSAISEARTFYERALERVRALPGVDSAAGVFLRPLWGTVGFDGIYVAEGQDHEAASTNPHVNVEGVTPGYFRTMRIRLVRGRDFDDTDSEQSPGVIIVSESMARRAWPGQDPLGKRIRMPMGESRPFHQQWLSVVGVVADVRYREIEAARLDVYMSYRQFASGLHHLVVRAEGDPGALAGSVRAAVRAIDPAQPVEDVRTMEEIVDAAVATRRLTTALFASLAAVALALAGLGVYGLMAYAVASRRREIGVRMALGAAGAHIMARVLVRGLALAAAGAGAGLLIALAIARSLRSLLYDVSTTDPTSFAGAIVVLMLLAAAGSYLPARRASRVDPIATLREE